jgi:hypothetical protein
MNDDSTVKNTLKSCAYMLGWNWSFKAGENNKGANATKENKLIKIHLTKIPKSANVKVNIVDMER